MDAVHCLPSTMEDCSSFTGEDDDEDFARDYPESNPNSDRSEDDFGDMDRLPGKRYNSSGGSSGDSPQSSAKKRRKQSNPVRLMSDQSQQRIGQNDFELSPSNRQNSKHVFQCSFCSQVFPNEEFFGYHMKMEHMREIIARGLLNGNKCLQDDTPLNLSNKIATSYRGGKYSNTTCSDSEDSSPKDTIVGEPTDLLPRTSMSACAPLDQPSFLLPFLSQHANVDQTASPAVTPDTSVKIFNPEAFCELCNKEFCNKYFLKTHKANKHGIYSDISLYSMPDASTVTGCLFKNSELGTEKFRQNLSAAIESTNNASSNSENHESSRPSSDSIRFHSLFQSEQIVPTNNKEFDERTPMNNYTPVHSASLSRTPDPTALNDCYPTDLSHSGKNLASNGKVSFGRIDLDMHSADQSQEMHDPPAERDRSSSGESIGMNLERLVDRASEGCSKDDARELEARAKNGTIRTDSFCNICCKEFCNKYFLKVHKYKKHAIGSPPERSGFNAPSEGRIECAPLERLLEAPLKDNAAYECDLCYRPFQSRYLLHMHKFYFHGFDQSSMTRESQSHTSASDDHTLNKEPFSQDLQKLQGMISGLKEKKEEMCRCQACGKLFENVLILQAHLLKDHGFSPQHEEMAKITRILSHSAAESQIQNKLNSINSLSSEPKTTNAQNSETVCTICKKECYAPFFLQQHMVAIHGLTSSTFNETAFLARIRREVEGQKKPDRPKPASTSRSYCEICNKELCNKYFMKTHMIKMHGINMDNHQSQNVKCDICHKGICSIYFLKVHKQNTHGIYDPEDDKALLENGIPKDEEGLDICQICSGKFKTAKLLECHMQSEHGAVKEKKNKSLPTSSSINSSNNVSNKIGISCSLCSQQFQDILSLRLHLIQAHPLQDHKNEENGQHKPPDNAIESKSNLLPHSFGSFGGQLAPFIRSERVMNLLPQINSTSLLESAVRSDTALPFPNMELQQTLLSQHLQKLANNLPGSKDKEQQLHMSPTNETKETLHLPSKPSTSDSSTKKIPNGKKYFCCRICRCRFLHRVAFLYHWHEKHIMSSLKQATWVGNSYKRRYRCCLCHFSARRRLTVRKHIYRRHHRSCPVPRPTATPTTATTTEAAASEVTLQMQTFLMSPVVGEQSLRPDDATATPDAGVGENAAYYLKLPTEISLPVRRYVTGDVSICVNLVPT